MGMLKYKTLGSDEWIECDDLIFYQNRSITNLEFGEDYIMSMDCRNNFIKFLKINELIMRLESDNIKVYGCSNFLYKTLNFKITFKC